MEVGVATQGSRNQRRGITGSTLKIIAIVAMLIDHIGAVLLEGKMTELSAQYMQQGYEIEQKLLLQYERLYEVDLVLRMIGRLGFPIFCFLLIEGFVHTRSRLKYGRNLLLFALISEIPFDLAFTQAMGDVELIFGVIYPSYQNVFFTLFIGLVCMCAYEYFETHTGKYCQRLCSNVAVLSAGMLLANLLHTDYSALGVLTITVMYLLRKNRVKSMFAGCLTLTLFNSLEVSSFFALLPIKAYNGQRGLGMKYFFYAFYPVHLWILYLISCYLR